MMLAREAYERDTVEAAQEAASRALDDFTEADEDYSDADLVEEMTASAAVDALMATQRRSRSWSTSWR